MKSYRKELWFRVPSRRGLVNITGEVEKALEESGVQEGLVLVNAMNITASVFINDDEPGLHRDLEAWLEKLAPEKPYDQYRHNGYEDNADAHLKRSVMGREAVVAVTGGRLDFGTWEQIFYYEFDGRRDKSSSMISCWCMTQEKITYSVWEHLRKFPSRWAMLSIAMALVSSVTSKGFKFQHQSPSSHTDGVSL